MNYDMGIFLITNFTVILSFIFLVRLTPDEKTKKTINQKPLELDNEIYKYKELKPNESKE